MILRTDDLEIPVSFERRRVDVWLSAVIVERTSYVASSPDAVTGRP